MVINKRLQITVEPEEDSFELDLMRANYQGLDGREHSWKLCWIQTPHKRVDVENKINHVRHIAGIFGGSLGEVINPHSYRAWWSYEFIVGHYHLYVRMWRVSRESWVHTLSAIDNDKSDAFELFRIYLDAPPAMNLDMTRNWCWRLWFGE